MTRQLTAKPGSSPAQTATVRAKDQAGALPRKRIAGRAGTRRDFFVFLALALPNLLLIAVFTYLPLFNNIYYSTLDWTLGSASATVVGLENYVTFFTSADADRGPGHHRRLHCSSPSAAPWSWACWWRWP